MTRLLYGEETQISKYLKPATRPVYDHVIRDAETEQAFVDRLERDDRVVVYIKLPGWFTVTTPIGEYNSACAVVMRETDEHVPLDRTRLYRLRETKSTEERGKLWPDERRKIECGERHFGALGGQRRRCHHRRGSAMTHGQSW